MEHKKLEELLNYLPVITREHDKYGWLGGKGLPISSNSTVGVRTFFEYLKENILIENIPEPSDVFGNLKGGITVLWDTDIVDETLDCDSFHVDISDNQFVYFCGELNSLGTKIEDTVEISPELDIRILEHMNFFKRKVK